MIALWRWYRNKSFMLKITSGFILGLIFGLTLETTNEVFAPLGVIFMNLLKMIVIPLIFLSLIVAVNHSNPADLGRIGVKVFPIYVITTAISVAIGLIIATLLQPGKGVTFSNDITLTIPERQGFLDTIINMVPTNIFKAFADGHILSVVFMAIITGLAILYMTHSTDNKQQKNGKYLNDFC